MAITWQKKSAHTPYDVDLVCRDLKTRNHRDQGLEINTLDNPMTIVCQGGDKEELLKNMASGLAFINGREFTHVHCNMEETPDTWWPFILVTVAQSLYTVPYRRKDYTIFVSPGETSWHFARRLADSVIWVKDLVNLPPNAKLPQDLGDLFQKRAEENGLAINFERLELNELKQIQAGGILAVSQGSIHPPLLLTGRYEGKPGGPWLGVVGKGITFDSGGISLKAAENMGRLKADMAGAAVAMACLQLAAEMNWPINILALAPLAENLPDGGAYRPGDIITMMDKTTVEIVSTDAEGRLVLADAMTYALTKSVSHLVDIATLTGTNAIALGGIRAGLVANDAGWAESVYQAGEDSLEKVWKLPHDSGYRDMNKSTVADLKNSGGRAGGTISAGMFVGHFARSVPWAHVDIAGMAINERGATGFGVLLMAELMRIWMRDYA